MGGQQLKKLQILGRCISEWPAVERRHAANRALAAAHGEFLKRPSMDHS
jgi:hypothetical protein